MFGAQIINLHGFTREFEPKAQNVQPGSADLCFLTETNVDQVLQALREAGIEVKVLGILLRLCAESLNVGPRGL